MNKSVLAIFWIMIICISGCAQTLPPHEGLNQALKKSFDATGLNYSSESKINNISISKSSALADSSDKRMKHLGSGLDIVRSISMKTDGAVDLKSNRSEALYELHYKKDNVEVSIKMPLLLDYNNKTLYVGESFVNTFLEIAYPQLPPIKNGLLKIDLNELLKDDSAGNDKFIKLFGENRFSAKNLESINNAFKTGVLKSLAKLDSRCLSELPLTEQDKKTGIERRIHMVLEHKDSVAVFYNLIDTVSMSLFQDGIINKEEYTVLLTLSDKQKLDTVFDQFTMTMIFNAGISKSGYVGLLESQINVADKEGVFQLGLSDTSTFSNYNLPQFSIIPEKLNIIDFKQVLDVIKADAAKAKEAAKLKENEPEVSNKDTESKP
jgi:hypothetical protein